MSKNEQSELKHHYIQISKFTGMKNEFVSIFISMCTNLFTLKIYYTLRNAFLLILDRESSLQRKREADGAKTELENLMRRSG